MKVVCVNLYHILLGSKIITYLCLPKQRKKGNSPKMTMCTCESTKSQMKEAMRAHQHTKRIAQKADQNKCSLHGQHFQFTCKAQNNLSNYQYFECLIFVGKNFRFKWRCYKLQRTSMDMHRTCARYKSTYQLTSRLMFGLASLYFAVQSTNICNRK